MELRRLILGLALAALAVAGAAPAFARDERGRLDPEERMRLRGAIQRHAWEDRVRAREAWRAGRGDAPVAIAPPGHPPPPPGYGPVPGYAPSTGYAPAPAYGQAPNAASGYGVGAPPPYGVSGGPDGQAYGYGFGPRPGLPRLSPEERDALRQQLREARRHALDQPGPGR